MADLGRWRELAFKASFRPAVASISFVRTMSSPAQPATAKQAVSAVRSVLEGTATPPLSRGIRYGMDREPEGEVSVDCGLEPGEIVSRQE